MLTRHHANPAAWASDARHTVRLIRPECGQLFMVYQGRGGQLMLPTLAFLRFAAIGDRNLILFRDNSRSNYQEGLSPLIPSMSAFIEWQQAQRELNFPHVQTTYCVGTSVGACAAIASGYYLEAPIVWAFAPPTTELLPPWVPSPPDEVSRSCADLHALLRDGNGVTEYRIFYNESVSSDREVAERLEGCAGVRLFPQAGEGHAVVVALLDSLHELFVPFETSRQQVPGGSSAE